jgi:hypothetical protein
MQLGVARELSNISEPELIKFLIHPLGYIEVLESGFVYFMYMSVWSGTGLEIVICEIMTNLSSPGIAQELYKTDCSASNNKQEPKNMHHSPFF